MEQTKLKAFLENLINEIEDDRNLTIKDIIEKLSIDLEIRTFIEELN